MRKVESSVPSSAVPQLEHAITLFPYFCLKFRGSTVLLANTCLELSSLCSLCSVQHLSCSAKLTGRCCLLEVLLYSTHLSTVQMLCRPWPDGAMAGSYRFINHGASISYRSSPIVSVDLSYRQTVRIEGICSSGRMTLKAILGQITFSGHHHGLRESVRME